MNQHAKANCSSLHLYSTQPAFAGGTAWWRRDASSQLQIILQEIPVGHNLSLLLDVKKGKQDQMERTEKSGSLAVVMRKKTVMCCWRVLWKQLENSWKSKWFLWVLSFPLVCPSSNFPSAVLCFLLGIHPIDTSCKTPCRHKTSNYHLKLSYP